VFLFRLGLGLGLADPQERKETPPIELRRHGDGGNRANYELDQHAAGSRV